MSVHVFSFDSVRSFFNLLFFFAPLYLIYRIYIRKYIKWFPRISNSTYCHAKLQNNLFAVRFSCLQLLRALPPPPASLCLQHPFASAIAKASLTFYTLTSSSPNVIYGLYFEMVCVCDSFQSVNCYNPHCPHHPPLACDPLKIFSFLLVFLTSPLSLFFYFLFFTYLAALTPPPLWYLYVLASLSESILSAEFSVRFPRSFFAKLMM